jgi:hypothetical protein
MRDCETLRKSHLRMVSPQPYVDVSAVVSPTSNPNAWGNVPRQARPSITPRLRLSDAADNDPIQTGMLRGSCGARASPSMNRSTQFRQTCWVQSAFAPAVGSSEAGLRYRHALARPGRMRRVERGCAAVSEWPECTAQANRQSKCRR